ncbi:MAG TPA: AMP-binding protein [Anaerolineae bacterium]|nr:AMP-binding protein [Anaerolineae bacterium]HNU05867.1 AMP-binding protein [Anaerolineae bacterium]
MTQIDDRLHALVQHAYAHAPAVRARFQAAGLTPDDVRRVADLARVPVMPKDELVALQRADPPFGGLLAAPAEAVRHIFMSPGPIYEPDAGDDASAVEMAVLAMRQSGLRPGDVVLNSLSYHLSPAGLLVDRALLALGCVAVPGGVGNTDLQLQLLHDLRISGYAGTPSFLLSLIRRVEERGMDWRRDFHLRSAFVTAEPLPASLRQTLVDGYGLAVGNAYGTAELGFLALNTAGGLAMQLLPLPIVQVVAPDSGQSVGPGEAGEVVVTNLDPAYPLIRLGTGDLAVNLDPGPGVSRQEERSIILVGRSGEAVKVRGMFVHPNQLRFAVAQIAPGAAVQGIVGRQEHLDTFDLRVALPAAVSPSDALAAGMQEAVRQACRVRVDGVEFVAALAPDAPGLVDQRRWE